MRLLDFLNILVAHRIIVDKIDDMVIQILSEKVHLIEP